ncbi:MAG TPA: hypothetical protein VLK34_03545 [Nocardioidaceae bacterium]|nr:hypothetical protein [Nocardioidaceae bacterium]
MNKRLIGAISAGALLASGVGGAVALSADASTGSGAAAKTHTWKFNAIQKGSHSLSKKTFAAVDVDKHKGKVVGYDTISGTFEPSTQTTTIFVAVARKGGILYGKIGATGPSTDFTGKVTGGSGDYKGATGTISTHELPNGNTTQVTVKWSN